MKSKTFDKRKQILTLIVNTVIVLDAIVIAGSGIFHGAGSGQVGSHIVGLGYLKPYTMDSNILAAFAALVMVVCSVKNLRKNEDTTPRWAAAFQLLGSACLFLTMMIAAVFLGPLKVLAGQSYFSVFQGDMFFFHLLNPVLSILSFTCLVKKYRFRRRESLIAAIPTYIYSFVYLTMVVIVKKWEDFYCFTFGGRYYMVPVVFIVIYSMVIGLSMLMIRWHNKGIDS